LAKAAKKAAKRSSKTTTPAVESSWPITPTGPPPARKSRKDSALADPALSTAIDEAVAEALDPPQSKKAAKAAKAAKAPKAARAARAEKTASKKKATVTKKVAVPKKAATAKKDPAAKKASGSKKAPAAKKTAAKKSTPQRVEAQLAVAPPASKRGSAGPPPAVNAPLSFINFVATYTVGSTIEGEVVSFTSHGAMVDVALPDGGRLHCYIPLSAMGTPPPTKAREMLTKGDVRPFVLAGLDPPRRVAELALPAPPAKRRRSPAKKAAKKST
jgi:hypothetical protein